MDDLERSLRGPALLPEGWSAVHIGGKHWEVTDPHDRSYEGHHGHGIVRGKRRAAEVVGRSVASVSPRNDHKKNHESVLR